MRARPGTLRVTVHQGRAKGPRGATDEERAAALAESDVVLCTYPQLQREATKAKSTAAGTAGGSGARRADAKILSRVRWRRVVLDECQMVRSSTTQLAAACRHLSADFRWMVSGTPLHAGVDDLNGELAFLGVWPFCLSDQTDGFWAHRIARPWAARDEDALLLLHAPAPRSHRQTHGRRSPGLGRYPAPHPPPRGPRVAPGGARPRRGRSTLRAVRVWVFGAPRRRGGARRARDAPRSLPRRRRRRAKRERKRERERGTGGGGASARAASLTFGSRRDDVRDARARSTARRRSGASRGGAHGGDAAIGGALACTCVCGHLNMSAAEAAAASDLGRVRALPAARALVELMAPREANRTGPTGRGCRKDRPAADVGPTSSCATRSRHAAFLRGGSPGVARDEPRVRRRRRRGPRA